ARARVGGGDAGRVSHARRPEPCGAGAVAATRRAAHLPAPAGRDRRVPLGARALGGAVLRARAPGHLRARDVRALARRRRPDAGARPGGRHRQPARVGRDQRPVIRRAPPTRRRRQCADRRRRLRAALARRPAARRGPGAAGAPRSAGAQVTIVDVVVAILMLAGLVGAILPFLPGAPLIFAGALLYALATDFTPIGAGRLAILAALGVLAWALEHVAGVVGA